jgi:excisionase family DNA binding protein
MNRLSNNDELARPLKPSGDTMLKRQNTKAEVIRFSRSETPPQLESAHARDIGSVWTSDEAAQYLRIHPRTLTRMAQRGEIPSIQIGRLWRFRRTDLDDWLTSKVNSVSYPCRLNS